MASSKKRAPARGAVKGDLKKPSGRFKDADPFFLLPGPGQASTRCGRRGAAGLGLDTALQLRPSGRRRVDSQRNGKGRLYLGFPDPDLRGKDGLNRKFNRQV